MDPNDDKVQQFVSLLASHQGRINSYILSLVPNFNDAGDILQETCKMMWVKFDEFEIGTDFLAWGLRMAYYRVLEYRRSKGRNKEMQLTDRAIEEVQEDAVRRQDLTKEYIRTVKKCFQALSSADKDLILMRYYENLRVKEITARLGKSLQNTYRNLARIQENLLLCIRRTLSRERLGA